MDKNAILEEFFRFLKDKDVFENYVEYVSKEEYFAHSFNIRRNDFKTINEFFKNVDYTDLVLHAFIWRRTREGHEFWENIHREWFIKI